MVRPERFELPTLWFEAKCSIQLSYGRTLWRGLSTTDLTAPIVPRLAAGRKSGFMAAVLTGERGYVVSPVENHACVLGTWKRL